MRRFRYIEFNQEKIVLAIAVLMFLAFSVMLKDFVSAGNIISLVQNVSILGVLGIGMALTILGRGIDLSMVANMAISVAWVLHLANDGMPMPLAVASGFGLSLAVGLINGLIIAYVEIPAIFATLAMGTAIYGFGHAALVNSDVIFVARSAPWFMAIGTSTLSGLPISVLWLGAIAVLAAQFLRLTRPGRFVYAIGDNPLSARITGVPSRPIIVLQYLIAALIAFLAGLITATLANSMNTRVATSSLVYDVILVVAIGGVGLSGGKGGVRNVLVGTLLVGTLVNGLTILDVSYTFQNIVKSAILLIAIVADSVLNPRDEQIAQQGDI